MAEEAKKFVPQFEPFEVTRKEGEGTGTLVFSAKEIGRGPYAGSQYPAVEVTDTNLDQVEAWAGRKVRISLLQAKLNQRCQSWYDEATVEADGKTQKPFDRDEFVKFASEFSARGESIKDIITEIEELTAQMVGIDWSLGAAAAAQAEDLGKQIKMLIIARENKRRKKDETAAAPVSV